MALVRDDARDTAKRVAATLSNDAQKLDVHVDTIKYDVGVVALMFGGMALMAVNLMAGGVLALAGPAIFAMFARGRVHEEVKKRAKELAPEVMRETAAKVGPRLEELIDAFVAKLDAWVVGTGEELQREVVEVLAATRQAKTESAHDATKAAADVDAQASALAAVVERLTGLRDSLAG